MKPSRATVLLCTLIATLVAAGAVAAFASTRIGTVITSADWPFVVYRITSDDLDQYSVRVSGSHVYWLENRQVPQGDGSVLPTPSIGRYLNRTTGARARIDPSPAGIFGLSAGGDWVVYTHEDAESTLLAWNPVTGERRTIATGLDDTWYFRATDGTHVVWAEYTGEEDADGHHTLSITATTIAPGPQKLIAKGAVRSAPAVDNGRVVWATSSPLDREFNTLHVYDIRSGDSSSVSIEDFSVEWVGVSGPLVVASGEDPAYTSHIYVWDTRTDHVRRIYSAPIAEASVLGAFISGTRVVFTESPRNRFLRVRLIDLATGAVADVLPDGFYSSAWDFDGSVVGMVVKRPGWPSLELALCDLDERRPTPPARVLDATVSGAASDSTTSRRSRGSGSLLAEADGVDGETTPTAEATRTAETTPAAGSDAASGSGEIAATGANAPGESDTEGAGGGLDPTTALIAALAGVTLVGGAGYAVRHRRAHAADTRP